MASNLLESLDPKVREYLAPHLDEAGNAPQDKMLGAIGIAIAGLRDEAKAARVSSGIEATWRACEEAYAGIDDANRGEMGHSRWSKPMTSAGPVDTGRMPTESDNKSTLFVNLTKRYVNAGTAKLGEILLAPGARSFSFTETPVPELIRAKDDTSQVLLDHLPGSPVAMRPLKPGEPDPTSPAPAAPSPAAAPVPVAAPGAAAVPSPGAVGAPQVPVTPKDLAEEKIEAARKKAKAAEKRIYDWMVECQRTAQVRKVIFDSGRLGVGVLEGPTPRAQRTMATKKQADGSIELEIVDKITPGSEWVDVWDFFPDPACGEDIHSGEHCFKRKWMSQRMVRGLKKLPGYIASQIDKVIEQGPDKVNTRDNGGKTDDAAAKAKKGQYEVWFFHGTLSREEMGCICEAAGKPIEIAADKKQVYAIVTMINDCVIRATINPLDSGSFPYHAMPWERATGCWAGTGIAEQIATPQKMLNASVRSMLNNAGISAGGQIVIDTTLIEPADGKMGMAPHKIWYMTGEGTVMDVNKAFGLFKIDNVTAELMQIVELAMRLGEESTSIPLVTQGQSGPTSPDTFGAANLQNNNANQLLRSIGYTFDDYITEPEVRQYYEYLILDPDVPNDEKGDFNIDAHGSSALVEKALQDQFVQQLLPLSVNPSYGLNPKKLMKLTIESKKLDPKDAQYTEEEQARIDAQPPPKAPAIEVAMIRAGIDKEKIAAIAADTQADNERADKDLATRATVDLHTLQLKKELAMLDYANRHQISLDGVKAELAKTAMTLEAQERMSARDRAGDEPQGRKPPRPQRAARQVAVPAVEPRGRAPNGKAFQA